MPWPLLQCLSEPDRHELLARCRRQRYSRNEVVFREGDIGDSVHLLAKGTVAVRVSTSRGDVATLDVMCSGEAFGEQALVGSTSERSATVVALEHVETLRLGRDDFAGLVSKCPTTAQLLIALLDARLRACSQDLADALFLSAEARVYKRVARLADIYSGHASCAIPVTQDDVGSMAGATRQTVNRVLREAEHDGLLRLARGRIEVLDRERLARRALS
jgi:CRP-like cAMP-binding protein